MRHRHHAAYCEVCDTPITNRGAAKKKRVFMLCVGCMKNPPEKYRCKAIRPNGKPCRALGTSNGYCHVHKESQSTSS